MIITPINFARQSQITRMPYYGKPYNADSISFRGNPRKDFFEKTDLNKYYSNFEQDNIDRISRLGKWKENLKDHYLEQKPNLALKIFESITAPLSKENHEQPPVFNEQTLNKTLEYMKKNVFTNFHTAFRKIYKNTLRHYVISGNCEPGIFDTTWVKIPSERSDKKNFKVNLEKLKILSSRKWCTKSTHAQTYLEAGDCYIYYDKGVPKIIINAKDNEIKTLQCGANGSVISFKYADTIEDFIKSENLIAGRNDLMQLQKAKETKIKVQKLKNELGSAINENNQQKIFNTFGIRVNQNDNGSLTISHYTQPDSGFTFKDLGIDENRLLKNVVEIDGCADFIRSNATVLSDLKRIGKDANFMYSKIKSLNNLEYIGGLANFLQMPNLKALPNLSFVGEKIAVPHSISLPKLAKTCVLYF